MAYFVKVRAVALATGAIVLTASPAAFGKGPPAGNGQGGGSSQSAAVGQPAPQPASHASPANGRSGQAPGHSSTRHASGSTGGGGGGSAQSQSSHQSWHASQPHSTSAPTRAGPQHTGGRPSPQSGPDTGSQTPGSLNTDCQAQKDPRDPGSCQEKGRGNTYDRDPFRGPNRGNDCDEGGGNNISGQQVTNPHNADSPDDTDRGQGNNRCATRSSVPETPPGNPPGTETPGQPGTPVTPATTTTPVSSTTPSGQNEVAGERNTAPESGTKGVSENSPSNSPAPGQRQPEAAVLVSSPAAGQPEETTNAQPKELPFTGFQALWLVLMGLGLGLLGLRLRGALRRRTI